jgi:hypothetical protein
MWLHRFVQGTRRVVSSGGDASGLMGTNHLQNLDLVRIEAIIS